MFLFIERLPEAGIWSAFCGVQLHLLSKTLRRRAEEFLNAFGDMALMDQMILNT